MIRISTNSVFLTATKQMNDLSSSMWRTQQQLGTAMQNLTPSDNPINTSRALEVTQSSAINQQFKTNRQTANQLSGLEDSALTSVTAQLQAVQALVVKAGNGSLSDVDRASIATELQGRFNDLLGLANTSDGLGGYLFSGFNSATQPFTQTATGASYQGDQGQRLLQVGPTRQLPISDSGSAVFENNATGNGTFVTAPDPGNLTRGGTGVISPGSVSNASQLTQHQYQINFAVTPSPTPGVPAVTTYTVTDMTLGTPVPPAPIPAVPVPYQSGQAITFDGQTMNITGAPADQDSFTVGPSTKQSLFTTMTNLINQLQTGTSGPAGAAALTAGLNAASSNLANVLNNVLTVQASVGSRQNELDSLESFGSATGLQYQSTLKDLQDLDYTAAISLFTQQQTMLDAAQKSFKAISGMSLFNYIS